MDKPILKPIAAAASAEVVHSARIDQGSPLVNGEGSLMAMLNSRLAEVGHTEAFQRLRATIAVVEALREGSDLEVRPEDEPELVELVEGPGRLVCRMLQVYGKLLRPRSFGSRILRYSRDLDDPARPWTATGLFNAAPALLDNSLAQLDRLMDEVCERTEEPSLAVWLHSLSLGELALFLAYVRRGEGAPAMFLIEGSKWVRVSVGTGKLRALLGTMLSPEKADTRAWEGFVRAQARFLAENHREGVEAALSPLGVAIPLSDAQWTQLNKVLYHNEYTPRLFQEAARDMARDSLHEAHALLEAMTESLISHLERLDSRKKELEKEFERKGRKMRSDLERSTLMRDGLQKRANRLEQENRELRQTLRAQSLQRSATDTDPMALARTLDSLF